MLVFEAESNTISTEQITKQYNALDVDGSRLRRLSW
jgi:hypothetical protein